MDMTNTEQRVAKMARQMAKVILQARKEGNLNGAKLLETVALETAAQMREGLI